MTASQIRDAMLQNERMEQRVSSIIESRRSVLRKSLSGKPFSVLHLVPLIADPRRLDVTSPVILARLHKVGPREPDHNGGGQGHWRTRHRLEGFELDNHPCSFKDRKATDIWSRILFLRDGTVEFVDAYTLRAREPGNQIYRYDYVEPTVHLALQAGMSLYDDGTLKFPVAVALSLENLVDMAWPVFRSPWPLERGEVLPNGNISPEPVVIHEPSNDYVPYMKPIWDVIWNAGGHPRCKGFDESGIFMGYSKSTT
jgi:hypothetical protein